ncbi:MAG: hypothetical protein OXM57_05750, partial [bacterium]|nr:hypothetical protein [bacterium]MDE0352174.1 hypothetical protein [bacterium]
RVGKFTDRDRGISTIVNIEALREIDGPATVSEIAWQAGIGAVSVEVVLDRLLAKGSMVGWGIVIDVVGHPRRYALLPPTAEPSPPSFPSPL